MVVRGYRELVVWQRAMELVEIVYAAAATLPRSERFGLADQLRRAAVSVPANIAEGHARVHRKEFLHFLSIARSSCVEVETHLLIAQRTRTLRESDVGAALGLCEEVSRMITTMRARLADALPDGARRSALGAQHTARKNSSQSRIP